MLEGLQKILKKNPIIPTAKSEHVIKNPEKVESLYREAAKTHMAIGDTSVYKKRIFDCILSNQTTFNGAVVGEYGFGKTSLLVYLWSECLENNILAVPPYQWGNFDEHVRVIHSWVKYKTKKYGPKLAIEIDEIYERHLNPSIESEAKKWARDHKNIDYETAMQILKAKHETGTINLSFKPERLVEYCSEITTILEEKTTFKGLLVITDELQQTITKLNHKEVYDFLFDITNQLTGAKGNFGFLWGFPERTQADLQRERSDILDRMNSNKAFIRLGSIYDEKFPCYLWDSFCENFDLTLHKDNIIDTWTLISIGQICDGSRRDIGNGPRSVISAFNVMANRFVEHNTPYTVLDFVDDCLSGDVVLGESSDFKKRVKSILSTPNLGEGHKKAIKFLAAFPQGIPKQAIDNYGCGELINDLVQTTGGLGKVVVQDLNTYKLKILRKITDSDNESVVEEEVRRYFCEFSPGKKSNDTVLELFNSLLSKVIFPVNSKSDNSSWKLECSKIDNYTKKHTSNFCGSFNRRFPQRSIRVTTLLSTTNSIHNPEPLNANTHLGFNFILWPNGAPNKTAAIEKNECGNNFTLNLDLSTQHDELNISKILDIVPAEKHSPMFFMGLVAHLQSAEIPNDEKPDLEHLITVLIENITYNIFNENMLGEVRGSQIELDNQGEMLISDLLNEACIVFYPDYSTLITSKQWIKKINNYKNVLKIEQSNIGLLEKRGRVPVLLSKEKSENKSRISRLFNVGTSSFESSLDDISSLASCNFNGNNNEFLFKIHPLENFILDKIISSKIKLSINDQQCKAIPETGELSTEIFGLGYTEEEFKEILEIAEIRRLFFRDPQSEMLYVKPENKDELKDVVRDFYRKVHEQVVSISAKYSPGPFELSELEGLDESIKLIESGEQASQYTQKLREYQSQCVHFSTGKLNQIKIDLRQLEESLKSKLETLDSIKSKESLDLPPVSIPWRDELYSISANLGSESTGLSTSLSQVCLRINNLTPGHVEEDEAAIAKLLEVNEEYTKIKSAIDFSLSPRHAVTVSKYKSFAKWKQSLMLADKFNTEILKYNDLLGQYGYKEKLSGYNSKVMEGLTINQAQTLDNHELFKNELIELKKDQDCKIDNLRSDWGKLAELHTEEMTKITGTEPNWRLRWSEHPKVSYHDLYEASSNEIILCIKALNNRFLQLVDDVLYTSQVLNHSRAVSNKSLDSRLQECLSAIAEIKNSNIREQVENVEEFKNLAHKVDTLNNEYSSINKDHVQIIKPNKIEGTGETLFLDILDAGQSMDLKSLIITFQKKCEEKIDLTSSRDTVLDTLKELFIKKQITIQVKRGKV